MVIGKFQSVSQLYTKVEWQFSTKRIITVEWNHMSGMKIICKLTHALTYLLNDQRSVFPVQVVKVKIVQKKLLSCQLLKDSYSLEGRLECYISG